MSIVTIIGFFGSLTSCMMFIPDALRVIKLRKNPHDLIAVSIPAKLMAMSNSVLWVLYAFFIHSFWLALPSSINFCVNIVTVTIVVKARHGFEDHGYEEHVH